MEFNRIKIINNIDIFTDREIIEMGVELLVEKEFATKELSNEIINLINKYGSYFVFEDENISIAHTKPGSYCKKLGSSLLLYKKGRDFFGKKNIKIFVTLCVPEKSDHMSLLKETVLLLQNPLEKNKILNYSIKEER